MHPAFLKTTPRGCLLAHWNTLKLIKKKKLIFFCNTAWPQYELDDQEVWPKNGSLSYSTIFAIISPLKKTGKKGKISRVQAFVHFYQNPNLRNSCKMCLAHIKATNGYPRVQIYQMTQLRGPHPKDAETTLGHQVGISPTYPLLF